MPRKHGKRATAESSTDEDVERHIHQDASSSSLSNVSVSSRGGRGFPSNRFGKRRKSSKRPESDTISNVSEWPAHIGWPRSDSEDEEPAVRLLPSREAFQSAEAARAADPLGLNPSLWERGWDGGEAHGNQTHAQDGQFSSIPRDSQRAASEHPSDEEGASDFSNDEERRAYVETRQQTRRAQRATERKQQLEERRLARIRAIEAASPDVPSSCSQAGSSKDLTQAQFNLMVRTAGAVRSSPNATQLEMKIYANHSREPRFQFLQASSTGSVRQIWLRLKSGEQLRWQDVDPHRVTASAAEASARPLISGYDSSEDSDAGSARAADHQVNSDDLLVEPSDRHNSSKGEEGEPSSVGADKRAQRLARARIWAQKKRQEGVSGASSSPPSGQGGKKTSDIGVEVTEVDLNAAEAPDPEFGEVGSYETSEQLVIG